MGGAPHHPRPDSGPPADALALPERLRLVRLLESLHRARMATITASAAFVLAIALADRAADDRVSLRYLFLVPVLAVTWMVSRRAGLALAALTVVSELAVDAFGHRLDPASLFDVTVRGAVLAVVVELLAELHQLVAERTREASIDSLTDLRNRRTFFADAEREMDRARRYGHDIATLFIDLDGFKDLNDTWGHGHGDAVLAAYARCLRASTRVSDVVGRMGGDEFAILLPESDADSALVIAQRVSQLRVGEQRIRASVGIATCPPLPYDLPTVLRAADADLYSRRRTRKGHGPLGTPISGTIETTSTHSADP